MAATFDDNTIYSAIDNLFRELNLSRDQRTAERIHKLVTSTQTLQTAGFQPVFYRRLRAVGAINRRFLPPPQPSVKGDR